MQQLVKLETKSLKTGNKEEIELFEALQSPRLKELDTLQPISDTLKYIIVLVGIRADNMPTAIEKQILLEFLKEEFPNMTTGEILQAFKMFASGKLEQYLKKDFGHFQNLSAMFVSEVIKAYLKYINERKIKVNLLAKIEEEKKAEPTQEEKEILNKKAVKYLIVKGYQEYIEDKRQFEYLNDGHFKYLESLNLVVLDKDYKKATWKMSQVKARTRAENKKLAGEIKEIGHFFNQNNVELIYKNLLFCECFRVWQEVEMITPKEIEEKLTND